MCQYCSIAVYYVMKITKDQAKMLLESGCPLTKAKKQWLTKVAEGKDAVLPRKAIDKLAKWGAFKTRAEMGYQKWQVGGE